MDRAIIDMPCGMFGPLESDWYINVRGRAAAGEGTQGTGQVIYGNQPRWETSIDLSGFGRDRVLAWRAIRASMRGRVNILRICVCDMWRPTYRELGLPADSIALLRGNGVPHSNGVFFNTGVGYGYTPVIEVHSGFDAGAEEITVDATPINDALTAGHFFSHDDWLYQVKGITGDGMTSRTYLIEPPLRRDIPANETIRMGKATALMAFADDQQGRMPLRYGKNGTANLQLMEWTNRP